jgi:hypothetical protein
LCVQGSTVHSSLVLRPSITAALCGPSVNMNRDAGFSEALMECGQVRPPLR